MEANIAKTRKEQELTEEMIKVRENKLQAEIAKQEVEEKIARMQLLVQQLANQFSVGNINECYERMMKESEGGGV